jgi:CubicO group peptidase (beta-lactamase class C family)
MDGVARTAAVNEAVSHHQRFGSRVACATLVLLASAACAHDKSPTGPVSSQVFVVSTPLAEGIDTAALSRLVRDAIQEHSEALIVLRNGKLVYENYFGMADEPIYAMSASKSFVDLAYGFMLAERRLKSLDERVATLLPTFAAVDPRKAATTYRHLLSQSSGLGPWRGTKDIEAYAIASPAIFDPGTAWQYSNNGVDLLAALAGRLLSEPLDQYLNEKLFQPLGITDVTWEHDTHGVPLGAGEMKIRPIEMAMVGQAILDNGRWRGVQVIPPSWIDSSFAPSTIFNPLYGLLWWRSHNGILAVGAPNDLLAQWVGNGLPQAIATKLRPIADTRYATSDALFADIKALLSADEYAVLQNLWTTGDHVPVYRILESRPGSVFYASGWLGQYLDVVPSKQLVAVRMRRARPSDRASAVEVDYFPGFWFDVLRLVP